MSNNPRIVKLPYDVIQSVLKTELEMDRFLIKPIRKWEIERLV
jgi:hypothetical protein